MNVTNLNDVNTYMFIGGQKKQNKHNMSHSYHQTTVKPILTIQYMRQRWNHPICTVINGSWVVRMGWRSAVP